MSKVETLKLQNEWRQRIREFRASGLGPSAWCTAHGFPTHRLHYWLRKFADNPVESPARQPDPAVTWLSISTQEAASPDTALVVRVGDACIEVRAGFDPTLLQQVVRTLAAVC